MTPNNFNLRFRADNALADALYTHAKKVGAENVGIRLLTPPDEAHQVMSIQVAATCHDGDNIEVVPEDSGDKTHFSVYTRGLDGLCSHVADFNIKPVEGAELARMEAMTLTASLSMQYQVPVEKIR